MASLAKPIGLAVATYTALRWAVGGYYGELFTKNGVKKVAFFANSFATPLSAGIFVSTIINSDDVRLAIGRGTFFLTCWYLKTALRENDPANQVSLPIDTCITGVATMVFVAYYKKYIE